MITQINSYIIVAIVATYHNQFKIHSSYSYPATKVIITVEIIVAVIVIKGIL